MENMWLFGSLFNTNVSSRVSRRCTFPSFGCHLFNHAVGNTKLWKYSLCTGYLLCHSKQSTHFMKPCCSGSSDIDQSAGDISCLYESKQRGELFLSDLWLLNLDPAQPLNDILLLCIWCAALAESHFSGVSWATRTVLLFIASEGQLIHTRVCFQSIAKHCGGFKNYLFWNPFCAG